MSQRSFRSRAALAGVVLASLAGYGSAAGQGDGKIPISTTSAEAKQQYVKGRALNMAATLADPARLVKAGRRMGAVLGPVT